MAHNSSAGAGKGPAAPRARLGLLAVCLGMIAAPMDSAVNIAFPSITAMFGLEVADIRWIAIVYVLTYASLLLVFGRLGDLIGHRVVFQVGLAITTLGFAACSLAPSFEVLLAARMLQGLGIALTLSCAPALATLLFDESRRTRVLAVYAAAMALGHAVGPLVGGVLVQHFGWSAVFWARLPLVLAALALSFVIKVRHTGRAGPGFDWLGSTQLALALCAIMGGLASLVGSSSSALPLVTAGCGAVLLLVFVRRQARLTSPIIRPALFRDPLFSLMNAASIVANLAAFSVVLIVPFHLVGIARMPTGEAGLGLALAAFGTIAASWVAPRIVRSFGAARTTVVGMALSSMGLAGIALWPAEVSLLTIAPSLLLQGVGLGLFQVAYTDFVTATLPEADRGVAGSLTMLTRSIGIVAGAAGLSAIHRYFSGATVAAAAMPADAFMAGFQAVFAGAAALQALALVIGIVIARSTGPAKTS